MTKKENEKRKAFHRKGKPGKVTRGNQETRRQDLAPESEACWQEKKNGRTQGLLKFSRSWGKSVQRERFA